MLFIIHLLCFFVKQGSESVDSVFMVVYVPGNLNFE